MQDAYQSLILPDVQQMLQEEDLAGLAALLPTLGAVMESVVAI